MSQLSFEYYYSLNEASKIELDQINIIKDDKLFVSVIDANKSFLIKNFVELPIIDTDDNVAFIKNESFVHIGTNNELANTKNRLKKAKENGFTNVLVLIDNNSVIAETQSQERVDSGERNEIPKERIIQSHEESKQVFETLIKDNSLVDFYVHKR